jgi:signal transduction histidine kinase
MRRLLVVYGTALAAALLVAFLVPLGLLASSLAHDRAVEAARQEAQGLTILANNASQAQLRDAVEAVNAGPRRTTVFLPNGRRLGHPMPRTPSVDLAAEGRSFTATTPGGVELLIPVGGADGVSVIRTFVPDALLTDGVHRAWLTLALVGLALLALAILVGDRIAARLSRSVHELAVVADRVASGDLTAMVRPAGPPEVRVVGRVLNSLGARISAMLADERELGADLSHRLRTPATALRLDADSLSDAEERTRMSQHVDHLVEAIDAAVRAARHPSQLRSTGECDAVSVVVERVRFWSVLAEESGRGLTLDVPERPCRVPVSSTALEAALDVLIDNVLSHTPAGTPFAVAVVTPAAGHVEVVVEDEGPGLATTELAERGRSGAGSTGIGLDVARRTVVDAGGAIRLERSPRGGARIVLAFPSGGLSQS